MLFKHGLFRVKLGEQDRSYNSFLLDCNKWFYKEKHWICNKIRM